MRRFAAISDVHGNLAALDAVLAAVRADGIEEVVNLGDSLSGAFDARGTAERLIALGMPTVMGNHDRMLVDRPPEDMPLWEKWVIDDLDPCHLDWIRALPATERRGDVLLCHATPASDDENWLERRGDRQRLVKRERPDVEARAGAPGGETLILCGHTHVARIVRLSDGRLVVNPGSVGVPAYLDTRTDPAFFHESGAPDARYAVLTEENGTWRAALCTVPYDPAPMAALARARGADCWARAIETGWMS